MEFKHIRNQTDSDVREILIYGVIGRDVNGLEVANELRFLIEYEDVKEIDIRINSSGGSMVEGFGIISALENAKNKGVVINCINDGLCASMGGLIFAVGDYRSMHDYSLLMLHNPNLGQAKIKDEHKEMIAKFRDSAITILKNKSGLEVEAISTMLDKETWLAGEEAKSLGLNDNVITTDKKEKKEEALAFVESGASALEIMNLYNGKKPKNKMKKVYNHLELEETSTEEQIVEAIENRVAEVVNEKASLTEQLETITNETTEKDAEIVELKDKVAELTTFVEASNKSLAEDLVNEAIKSKKIKEDAKASFLAMEVETLKNVLNAIETPKANLLKEVANTITEPATKKTFRELEKENPSELNRIKNETPEIYAEMYKAEYGTEYNK